MNWLKSCHFGVLGALIELYCAMQHVWGQTRRLMSDRLLSVAHM
jgi:hypothetical protein